jgi:hypothetical protein
MMQPGAGARHEGVGAWTLGTAGVVVEQEAGEAAMDWRAARQMARFGPRRLGGCGAGLARPPRRWTGRRRRRWRRMPGGWHARRRGGGRPWRGGNGGRRGWGRSRRRGRSDGGLAREAGSGQAGAALMWRHT